MTETANVNCAERYECRPWREAAESYGRDVQSIMRQGGDADVIRLYTRIAARFADLALRKEQVRL